MFEPRAQRNLRLYGRNRVPRRDRRVMVALLAAPGLSPYPLSRLAQVRSGGVRAVLVRLEALGWVRRVRHETYSAPVRHEYTLTSMGRESVTLLLGLGAGDDNG